MKRQIAAVSLAGLLLLSGFALMGCGAGAGTASDSAVYETTAASPAAAMDPQFAAETAEETGIMKGSGNTSSASGSFEGEISASLSPAVADESRKLIRSVSMSVETVDFDGLTKHVQEKVAELGGYIESSNTSGASLTYYGVSSRYTYLKARIPSDHLYQFVGDVESNSNVTNKSEQTTDVTLEYSDIESRKRTLETEQERLWELLETAESLDAVIALESRLSEIRYQLESFESQLRLYDNQVDYSTVELHISEVQSLTPTAPDNLGTRISKGFDRSLSRLADNTISLFVWVVSNSPYLILLAAAWMIVRRFLQNNGSGREHRGGWFGRKFKKQNENSDDQTTSTIDNDLK